MQHHDSIIFDLDGTLWDASHACAEAWNTALKKVGVFDIQVTADDIRKISGLPFEECVRTLFSEFAAKTIERISSEIDSQERIELIASGGRLRLWGTDHG